MKRIETRREMLADFQSEHFDVFFEPNPPKFLYHVAPKSAKADIISNGLDASGKTWNIGAGINEEYKDEHIWDQEGIREYRPEGIYMFESLEAAKQYKSNNDDIYQIDTTGLNSIIRDPSNAHNWDYLDEEDKAYVVRYIPPQNLQLNK